MIPQEDGRHIGAVAWVLVAFVVGALASGAVVWSVAHSAPSDRVGVDVLQAETIWVNSQGTAIGSTVGGYDISGADGRECVVPLSGGQPLVLGVVHTKPTGDQPGRDVVVWVQCLGSPTTQAP